MMDLHHPTNLKFMLFHLIDKSHWEPCYILTILKSAESYTYAMISALLPYLLWKFAKVFGEEAAAIAKWFKPTACAQATDAYWDPQEECMKNMNNKFWPRSPPRPMMCTGFLTSPPPPLNARGCKWRKNLWMIPSQL